MKKIISSFLLALSLLAGPVFAADFPTAKVLFASGKTEVPAESADAIKKVVEFLEAGKDAKVQLSGYNDPSGDPAKNAELSKQRAFAVRDALKAAGVAEDRIVLKKPEDTNKAGNPDEARAVEISLFAPAAAPAAATAAAPAPAAAASAAPAPVPNKGDVAWMIVATAFVIMMSIPGLALFYGGLVRSKNMLSVLMQVFVTFSMIVVLWCIYGYSLRSLKATSSSAGSTGCS